MIMGVQEVLHTSTGASKMFPILGLQVDFMMFCEEKSVKLKELETGFQDAKTKRKVSIHQVPNLYLDF